MIQLGYALSSEEHPPNDLVHFAQRAEEIGFDFAMISDHYHPWISAQGQSPFVWSVIGAIAQTTTRLRLGTGVTCPIIRIHPAILAQATATVATMMPGRFFFGVGAGENLNEHILGDRWPPYDLRIEMLEEAVEVIRLLWEGKTQSHWGTYYTVEDAHLFTHPDEPPAIMVAAGGSNSAEAAGQFGDGMITVGPHQQLIDKFHRTGGEEMPCYGQLTVCWANDAKTARRTVHEQWPNSGLTGEMTQELRTVTHFEQAVKMVTEERAVEHVVCGPDVQEYLENLRKFVDAGYDYVYLHQIGDDQEGFFHFCQKELLPQVERRLQ
ncbi:MAG TPA: TIGR03557 family F420-dependent LLM class oxidoreductase [Caldilineaceae bacterium]|nr:TIGR03557 family F420-dependent LLM class oxidoreductase [Caldilineaceae bacterium]